MSENSAIEWCDHTFNPWMGCTKVGPGCDRCYAETLMDTRYGKVHWGVGQPRLRTAPANWRKPLAWQKNAAAFQLEHGRRQRVFCASLADVFDNAVDPAWRRDLFELILSTPDLDWLLLTKRIGNVIPMLKAIQVLKRDNVFDHLWPHHLPNVWLGATIVNQEEADRDIPKLLATPARVRFLSCEPLLGPIDLLGLNADDRPVMADLDWVIAGGESGPGARPIHPDWARGLRDQCAAAGVPFLFKQFGEWAPADPIPGVRFGDEMRRGGVQLLHAPGNPEGFFRKGDAFVRRVGKKAAGRLLDGVQHDGFPA